MTPTVWLYLLKANLIIAAVWLFCRVLLTRDTRFGRKRMIINGGISVALLLPLLALIPAPQTTAVLTAPTVPVMILPTVEISAGAVREPAADYASILLMIYLAVTAVLLMRTALRVMSVMMLDRRCRIDQRNGFILKLIPDSSAGPFSFFGKIYTGENVELTEYMLNHEAAHINQHHSADILLTELMTDLLWINPAAWLLRREATDNLEFLADDAAIDSGNLRAYQLSLLDLSVRAERAPLCASFNVSSIKRRIIMINRISTTSRGRWIYALILPILLLATAVGCARQASTDAAPDASLMAEDSAALQTELDPNTAVKAQEETADSTSQPEPVELYAKAGEPSFPDDAFMMFVTRNTEFPESAANDSVTGTVQITFTIDSEGNLTDAKVTKSVRKDVDEAALEAVKRSPRWRPARDRQPRSYSIPITFRPRPITKPAPRGQ
ncbi:MAG: TonB family protein [Paramuribaculum sp.]|nr:TonB family protein [Paramuribaculum sp.]